MKDLFNIHYPLDGKDVVILLLSIVIILLLLRLVCKKKNGIYTESRGAMSDTYYNHYLYINGEEIASWEYSNEKYRSKREFIEFLKRKTKT